MIFFHADPHPGNILILNDNKIALLDFGIVGKSLIYNKASFVKFLKGMTQHDRKEATYHFSSLVSEDLKNMIGSAIPASHSLERLDEVWRLLASYFSRNTF